MNMTEQMKETPADIAPGADYMVRASAADAQLRAFAVTGRGLTQTAHESHGTSPVATAALGRTMCGALMMADMLKGEDDVLTVKIDGDGPLHGIVVTADNHGHVKGYVHEPDVWLPDRVPGHLNVGGAVGRGSLTVIRDLGLKDPYIGRITLRSGEIAEDLTYYYAESEQIPSTVGLGVLVDTDGSVLQAGGFVVQLMPAAGEEIISRLEQNLQGLPSVTEMLTDGCTPEQMLERILEGLSPVITERTEVSFRCDCSEQRCERGLILLGEKELRDLISEDRDVEMKCQFCGRRYRFTPEHLRRLLPLAVPVSREQLEGAEEDPAADDRHF